MHVTINKLKPYNKGVLLIICLIFLVILSSMLLTVAAIVTTNSKANTNYSNTMNAKQKATSTAMYAMEALKNLTQLPTTCDAAKSCLVWKASEVPANIMLASTDSSTLAWWNTYGQDSPIAPSALTSTHGISKYIMYEYSSTITATEKTSNIKVISYATDNNTKTAAIKELNYTMQATLTDTYLSTSNPIPEYITFATNADNGPIPANSNGIGDINGTLIINGGSWGVDDSMSSAQEINYNRSKSTSNFILLTNQNTMTNINVNLDDVNSTDIIYYQLYDMNNNPLGSTVSKQNVDNLTINYAAGFNKIKFFAGSAFTFLSDPGYTIHDLTITEYKLQ